MRTSSARSRRPAWTAACLAVLAAAVTASGVAAARGPMSAVEAGAAERPLLTVHARAVQRPRLAVDARAVQRPLLAVDARAAERPLLAVHAGAAQIPQQTFERIALTTGRSQVLMTDFDVIRLAVTDPEIADAVLVESRQVLIDGKGLGTVSLILWGTDKRVQYDVVVEPAVSALQQQFRALFPNEEIRVGVADEALVLSGSVSSNAVAARAGELALAAAPKLKIVNWLEGPESPNLQQVMLQVRFAEVGRTALDEVGAALVAARNSVVARTTTQQSAAPDFEQDDNGLKLTFSDFLNVFYFNLQHGIGAVIRALEQRGQFQSLAEPNLVAYDGQEASFLAGGEFPVPIVQGTGVGASVSVLFKEFGIRLSFRPTINGDLIRLKVRPEVSSLDFANGLQLSGFVVPALITRRAETEVELRDGQSFAIAGLLNNTSQVTKSAIPLLSRLPIIGHLFRSSADRAGRTELLVLITPHLVRPLEPGQVPALPTDPAQFVSPGDGLGSALDGGGGLVDAPTRSGPQRQPRLQFGGRPRR